MKPLLIAYGLAGLVLAAAGVFVYRKLSAGALNPANPENVVNQGVTSIVQQVTGDKDQTLGGAIFDFFNPNAGLAPGEALLGKGQISPVRPALADAGDGADLDLMIGAGA